MDEIKTFKYALPYDCPKSIISAKQLNEGTYGIEYFRIAKESPPSEEDFLPQFFQSRCSRKVEKMEKESDRSNLCQMASVSLLKTEDDAIKLIRKFKNIGKYIFCGIISKDDGLIIISPSRDFPSHCSFFVYTGVDESRIFNRGVYP